METKCQIRNYQRKSPMESHDIPEDVIIQILTRLPTKSLIRLKCINKSWRDLISSYDFATRHFDFNKNKPLSYIRMSSTSMILFNDGKRLTRLHRPFMENKTSAYMGDGYIVGSSSGLVCFWRNIGRFPTIWNPATAEFRCISPPKDTVGFELVGFDARPCGDYRVVVIFIFYTNIKAERRYSRSSNCWERISNAVGRKSMKLADTHVVCLDGCMFWPIWRSYNVLGPTSGYQNVACFDMWEEKYRYITGPPSTGDSGRLGVVNGSSLGFFFSGQVEGTLDGWVMNRQDESWTKQYNIVLFTPLDYNKPVSSEEMDRRNENKGVNAEEVDTIILDRRLHYYHHPTKIISSATYIPFHLDDVLYKETLFLVNDPTM